MAIQSTTNNNPCALSALNYSNKDLTQCGGDCNKLSLLTLPQEIFNRIMEEVCNETSPMKGAIYAVNFGRVSLLTYAVTYEVRKVYALIQDETKFGPFMKVLSFNLNPNNGMLHDLGLATLKNLLDDKDLETSQERGKDLCADFVVDHPGLDDDKIQDEFHKQYIAYYKNKNVRETFSVYTAIFMKTMETWGLEPDNRDFLAAAKFASDIIASDPEFQQEFGGKIYKIVGNCIAQKPLTDLTISEYNRYINLLSGFFPETPQQEHENALRQGLRKFHDTSQFDALIEKYSNPSDELLEKGINLLRNARIMALQNVEREIDMLCGNNMDGEIHQAYVAMQKTEVEMHHFKQSYIHALNRHINEVAYGPIEGMREGKMCTDEVFQMCMDAIKEHQDAKNKYQSLNERLAELAVWTNGVMTGGMRIEIKAHLEKDKLLADAKSECKTVSEFYTQLKRPIGDINKNVLFYELHKIIGVTRIDFI